MLRRRCLSTAIVAIGLLATATNAHVLSATEESEVRVVPNPHACPEEPHDGPVSAACGASASCEPSLLLSPHRILRTPMATQPDTLVEVTTKKVLSVPVPVYHFRQPARLSSAELPFRLVLVSDIDTAPAQGTLHQLPVDPEMAWDSWFPGYAWTPVVYSGCEYPVHVGWKFTAVSGEFFYALIIDAKEEEKGAVQFTVGALGEMIAESLNIGTRAPSWMVDMISKM
mmetsp:Transcript_18257/g.38346  ORF Transcript_18257/g.38346 Transcript_18257/m.38346 type:complete len:227 (+) Transcript_18257:37-717(+)